ncbi:MAG: hypothetical protein D6803_00120 [Anaerolineae bacterium]|nr:MAG: hypothetical protein D6803_00120 [Anaerolineae bacterium]
MTDSLDQVLLPIVRRGGKEVPRLPGVHVAMPPRRAARGRSRDRLFVYLKLEGNAPLSPTEMERLTAQLAAEYYRTAGSATSAMRAVAEGLNELLLHRNLSAVNRGRQAIGVLVMGVVRGERLFLLQCGSAQSYLINAEGVKQFHEPGAGRGLGVGRAARLQFYQTPLKPGDTLLMSPNPPLTWNTTTLRNLRRLVLKELYARLLRRTSGDIEAVALQVTRGKGRIRLVGPASASEARPSRPAAQPQPTPPPPQKPATPVAEANGVAVAPLKPPPPPPSQGKPATETQSPSPPAAKSPPRESRVRAGWRALRTFAGSMWRAFGTLLARLMPEESALNLPPSTLMFIAVAVPLIVVAVSMAVYLQRGEGALYEVYVERARQAGDQAETFEHAAEQRIGWQAVLEYVDLAEEIKVTEETQRLRALATQQLDNLDKVVRIEVQRAFAAGELPAGTRISRLAISQENDLYMLDATTGQVYRAVFTGKGYERDEAFYCGKVQTPLIVSDLVDIAPLPPGHPAGATLIGLDGDGNLVECIPGRSDQLIIQPPAPDSNWGTPRAIALDGGDLYVLDTLTNSVWVYSSASNYSELPEFFFGNDVPDMQNVVDITATNGTLYLLNQDSSMIIARYQSDVVDEPAIYQDSRPDLPDGPTLSYATFRQLQYSPPPDPSIYLLDGEQQAVYHLSLQLVYQRQYRPVLPLPEGEVTAFAIGPDRRVFLATGDQVYFGFLP